MAFLLPAPPGTVHPGRRRAIVGAGVGLGQFGIGLWWVTGFHAVGYVALVFHATAIAAVAAVLVPADARPARVVGLPAAWMVAEWLTGHWPFGGLPIGGSALGQVAGPLVPVARLGGALALAGVTALAGAGLAELVRAGRHAWRARATPAPAEGDGQGRCGNGHGRRGDGQGRRDALAGALALLMVALLVLAGRLSPDGAGSGPHPRLRIAAVQGGGPRGLRAVDTDPDTVTRRQLDESARLGADPPLDLVLWPEDVVHVDGTIRGTAQGDAIAALARRLHAVVVAGVVEEAGDNRFRNAAVAFGPQGAIVARYEKVHRVPFGEFVPERALFARLANLSLVPEDAIPGRGPGVLTTPSGPYGVVISFEVFYDELARAAIKAGGQVLLVPTNASSYRTSQVPAEEVAAARLKAIETGRDTVQASPTGYSAVVDHGGRVMARTGLGSPGLLVATVEARTGQTVFVRFGDEWLVTAALLWLAAVALALARRRSQASLTGSPTSGSSSTGGRVAPRKRPAAGPRP